MCRASPSSSQDGGDTDVADALTGRAVSIHSRTMARTRTARNASRSPCAGSGMSMRSYSLPDAFATRAPTTRVSFVLAALQQSVERAKAARGEAS